ncbi:MAG: tRNA-uridine aminocarboxypropyltransferase [Campylobacterota bacterium]|nr:tRNA-uridine aminocarboxypropyltransferase [Campylobacterota bacterium]
MGGINYRDRCYKCYRPQSSCMCKYIKPIDTKTKFIILMHPKEFQKTKNGTGHFTNISLKNSKLFIGIDFTNHNIINRVIDDENNNCYVLYPDEKSINLNTQNIKQNNKSNVVFIIDSTWACSKKILRLSENITNLPKVSFTHSKSSAFKIKTQPNEYCLSTIESTLCVIELLIKQDIEDIEKNSLDTFLAPFNEMVKYQLKCINEVDTQYLRYKKPFKKSILS